MRRILAITALAGLLAGAAWAGPPPASNDEYGKEIVLSHQRIATGFPVYDRASWPEVAPCLTRADRPYCLLRAMADGGEARDLRWDLAFLGHQGALDRAGVTAEAASELALPEDLVNAAVWRALEAAGRDDPLAPIRAIRVNYSAVELKISEPRAGDLRVEALRRLLDVAEGAAQGSAEAVARARRIAPAARDALVKACVPPVAIHGDCDPDFLASLLARTGDVDTARKVEQRGAQSPAHAEAVIILAQVRAALDAGRLDEAAAQAFAPQLAADRDMKWEIAHLREDVIAHAAAVKREDIAIDVARRQLAAIFPPGLASPDGVADPELDVLIRAGDKAELLALAERFDAASRPERNLGYLGTAFRLWRAVGRDDRASALVDRWLPAARAGSTAGLAWQVRQLQIELGRKDLITEAETGAKPSETLGNDILRLGPEDPSVRHALAATSPQRRAAAYYSCAYAANEAKAPAVFLACLEAFDPAAAPPEKVDDMACLGLRAAAEDRGGDRVWRERVLRSVVRLARLIPQSPKERTVFDYEMMRDFIIAELKERGEF